MVSFPWSQKEKPLEKVWLWSHPFYDVYDIPFRGGGEELEKYDRRNRYRRAHDNWAVMRWRWGRFIQGLKNRPNEILVVLPALYFKSKLAERNWERLLSYAKKQLGRRLVTHCHKPYAMNLEGKDVLFVLDMDKLNEWIQKKKWIVNPDKTKLEAFGEYEQACVTAQFEKLRDAWRLKEENCTINKELSVPIKGPTYVEGPNFELSFRFPSKAERRKNQQKKKKAKLRQRGRKKG